MDAINSLVTQVVDVYKHEDYDYVVNLAKNGERPVGIDTVEDGMDWLKRNGMDGGLSDDDLRTASGIILEKIREIDDEVWDKYHIDSKIMVELSVTQVNWLYFELAGRMNIDDVGTGIVEILKDIIIDKMQLKEYLDIVDAINEMAQKMFD
jgi:hypothetical protein